LKVSKNEDAWVSIAGSAGQSVNQSAIEAPMQEQHVNHPATQDDQITVSDYLGMQDRS